MSEAGAIQFLVSLIAPFMVAYGIGYFIRKSIKVIAFLFGMFFFIVGVFWYVGVIDSFGSIQKWTEDVVKIGYDKTQELSNKIGMTVDQNKEGSASQMNIIIGISSFFTGLVFGLQGGKRKDRGLRIITD
jgi:uncharacterized membrane protein (Fun14 family)